MHRSDEITLFPCHSSRLPPPPPSSLSSSSANMPSAPPPPKLLAVLRKTATCSEHEESDSDDQASTPKAHAIDPASSSPPPVATTCDEEDESDGETAYQRMRERLAARERLTARKRPAARKSSAEQSNAHPKLPALAVMESSEDEDTRSIPNISRNAAVKTSQTGTISPPQIPHVRSRHSSPALFVPSRPSSARKKQTECREGTSSDSDRSSSSQHITAIHERIQRIRAERLARQQEQDEEQSRKLALQELHHHPASDSNQEEGGRPMQQAKPTRKAGRKALEAMAREQQRISRNMQLTHQAKTRKKYTTKDLFTRMAFNPSSIAPLKAMPTPEASLIPLSSDAELNHVHDTPPTSPPSEEDCMKLDEPSTTTKTVTVAQPVPIQGQPPTALKANEEERREPDIGHLPLEKTNSAMLLKAWTDTRESGKDTMVELSDSEEDELGNQRPKTRFPVFDRIPAKIQQESVSLLHLRSLALLKKSPKTEKAGQKFVTLAEMERSLAQKARQQKNKQQEERIAELRQRGYVIETEDEREKRQMEIEDMVARFEKQRQEDLDLAKAERSEAKKNGETVDELPSSDESEDDLVASEEENGVENEAEPDTEPELELSGSESEQETGSVKDAGEDDSMGKHNSAVNDEADESDETEEHVPLRPMAQVADTENQETARHARRRTTANRSYRRVIDEDDVVSHAQPNRQPSQHNTMSAFGFNKADTGLGLTQVFAGTIAELESGSQRVPAIDSGLERNPLDLLRKLPDTQPAADFSQSRNVVVPNSQSFAWPRGGGEEEEEEESQTNPKTQTNLHISQHIKTSPPSSRTQCEDFEPTQDAGFSFSHYPIGLVMPPSTSETVMMPIAESPIRPTRSRLQRGRRAATADISDADENVLVGQHSVRDDVRQPPTPKDAFLSLKRAAEKHKAANEFNKTTSLAKEAIMEQAEESEDEYAGLGGASDDEEGEEDQELLDMIDHDDVKVDEREIAAFYAEEAKKNDEKHIADLYRKIQTGGLRRGAVGGDGFDMSDSDDDMTQRQRKKQAAFQKMSRALLQDERVKHLADDPKKKPFFNTLADFADEEDYRFLDMPSETREDGAAESQDGDLGSGTRADTVVPDSQAAETTIGVEFNNKPLKRKNSLLQKENRPPPHLRRTAAATDNLARRPITHADVQNSLSELLDDGRDMVPDSQYSDSDDGEAYCAPDATRRKSIIDRLSLSRTPTIESPTDDNMAFHTPSRMSTIPGFRVPSLVRQATSNMSAVSESRGSSGTNTPSESVVRRGGSGKSNIHAQAREAERQAMLEKKDGRRKVMLKKKVEGARRRAGGIRSVLQDLGGGFE